MTAPFPAADTARILRDPHPAVRAAARRAMDLAFDQADPAELVELLWGLAATDAHELVDRVVPLLGHPHRTVRQLAAVCLRSLHPPVGLVAMPLAASGDQGGSDPAQFMADWLAGRSRFVAALDAALESAIGEERARLLSSLSELPGERALIDELTGHDPAAAAREKPVQLIIALTYRCNRSCPYCYANESMEGFAGADIDLEAAGQVLDWAVAQGATTISFTGGEPTCHPHFAELVEAVRARGLTLYLNSNGLMPQAALQALCAPHIANVGMHVSERRIHRTGELETIAQNARVLMDAGVEVFVRHTIWRTHGNGDIDWLVGFCERLGVRHLNLALGFPGRTASNHFVPGQRLVEFKPLLLRALSACGARGIRVRMAKPVPLCLLERTEFSALQRQHELLSVCSVHARAGVHNLVVNPDRSTYPCVGLPQAGPRIDAAPDYAPQRAHCAGAITRALGVVQRACHGCAMRRAGVCQAMCLGHQHDESLAASPTHARVYAGPTA